MDELKRATVVDYTAQDLNVKGWVAVRNRQKLEAVLKRKARRKAKAELKHTTEVDT